MLGKEHLTKEILFGIDDNKLQNVQGPMMFDESVK